MQWLIAHSLAIIGYLLAIILIPRVLLERRHPGATVAWLLAIGLVPLLGVPLYFLVGGKRIKKISRAADWRLQDGRADPPLPERLILSAGNRRIAHLLIEAGAFPPAPGNRVNLIDDGVQAYTTLVDMVESARESIEIATFILRRDKVGRSLVKVLARRASQGVKVRLLLDALGCFTTRGRFVRPLQAAGGRVGIFMPLLPLRRPWSANLRNHRKIAVVDGCRALVGGMNLAREYMGPTPYEKRWKDVCLEMSGRAVEHVRLVFSHDWAYSTGERLEPRPPLAAASPGAGDSSVVQVISDGPDMQQRPLYSGILAALNQAQRNIWVVTPYFVPDEPLSAALELAARMGRDVRLIMPERSNHPLVDLAGSSFLPDLLNAGVRLYRYQPGMLHAKMIAVDKELAVVGTANMDIRSFQLNFEIATFLYDRRDVQKVIRATEAMMRQSRLVNIKEIEQKGRIRRFSEDFCRVFSPLL